MNLTKKQVEAATLLFDDILPDREVAEKLGVDERTLRRWQNMSAFIDCIAELRHDFINKARRHILASKEYRLCCKMDRHRAITRIIAERAAACDPSIPGAASGLLTKRVRITKDGETIEYRFDSAPSKELSRLEAEINKELLQEEQKVMPENYFLIEPDTSALTKEDRAHIELCQAKLNADNPWLDSIYRHPFPDHEVERVERAIAARKEEKHAEQSLISYRQFQKQPDNLELKFIK
jgi:hypothetical protein